MTSRTAYIDMEFAGIYGTLQGLQIPIEIGIVIHEPISDTLSFAGKTFSRDISVELWKNITDDVGKRIVGQRRVFNLSSRGQTTPFDKSYRLSAGDRKKAQTAIAGVHQDLMNFLRTLNQSDIGTLVFFARRREIETFRHAGVNTDGFCIRDLQEEIREAFRLKEHISLDRVSLVTGFGISGPNFHSCHFSYPLPEKYRFVIKPHKAIGDAARMILIDRELQEYPEDFGALLRRHIEAYDQRRQAETEAREHDKWQI